MGASAARDGQEWLAATAGFSGSAGAQEISCTGTPGNSDSQRQAICELLKSPADGNIGGFLLVHFCHSVLESMANHILARGVTLLFQ